MSTLFKTSWEKKAQRQSRVARGKLWAALGHHEREATQRLSDPDYLQAVVSILKEERRGIADALVTAYALSFNIVAQALLDLLSPTLSSAEKKYVQETGPQIVRAHYLHDIYREPGGCDEAREERRRAVRLEEEARMELTAAGVSEERQQILEELLFASDESYLSSYPPEGLSNIIYHLKSKEEKQNLSRLRELASALYAPGKIQDFLETLERCAREMGQLQETGGQQRS